MLDYKSTAVMVSEIDPDVRITFKKFSAGRKVQLEAALAPYREETNRRMVDYAESCIINEGLRDNAGELVIGDDGKPVDPGDSAYVQAQKRTRGTAFQLWLESAMTQHVRPHTLRTYLKSIEGLRIDGQPATTDTFIEDGPEELADEAFAYIQKHGGLTDEERKNSQSRTISPVAADGDASSTTASVAAPPAGLTQIATAASTTTSAAA